MEQPLILPDHQPSSRYPTMVAMTREQHRAYHFRGEMPPLLPDHHADAALDGWFESRRARCEVNRWDMLGALAAIFGAVVMAALL